MIVSWLLRLAAGIIIGRVWRRLTGRRHSVESPPLPVPIRPDREYP
jgi:hypothetical protein